MPLDIEFNLKIDDKLERVWGLSVSNGLKDKKLEVLNSNLNK